MLVRLIQITARRARAEEKRVRLMRMPEICIDLWDGDVVIPGLRILY